MSATITSRSNPSRSNPSRSNPSRSNPSRSNGHHQDARRPSTGRPVSARRHGAACERGPVTPRRAPAAAYRRRRAVVGTLLAVLVAASTVLAHDVLAGSGGVPASAAESQPARQRSTVTARPGDTLWSIAEEHRGDIPISRYVDALVDLNGGASIQAGQAVVLP